MFWLVVDTLLLMAVAVVGGAVLGVLARQLVGRSRAPDPAVAAGAGDGAPVDGGEAPSIAAMDAMVDAVAAEAAEVVPDLERAADADRVGRRPPALSQPADGSADDLKAIGGIGPQNERLLNDLGIFNFSQIAAWTPEEAKWVGAYLAFPGRVEREDWVGQAQSLAGDASTV